MKKFTAKEIIEAITAEQKQDMASLTNYSLYEDRINRLNSMLCSSIDMQILVNRLGIGLVPELEAHHAALKLLLKEVKSK